jgi:hypothetical protein
MSGSNTRKPFIILRKEHSCTGNSSRNEECGAAFKSAWYGSALLQGEKYQQYSCAKARRKGINDEEDDSSSIATEIKSKKKVRLSP